MNKALSKCGLYALSLCLSLVAFSVLSSDDAFATTSLDDNYHTTTTLPVQNTTYDTDPYPASSNCSVYDPGLTWSSYITDESKWSSNMTTFHQTAKTSFLNAINGGRWGVSHYTAYGDIETELQQYIMVYWTEDTDLQLNWDWSTDVLYASSLNNDDFSYVRIQCIDGFNYTGYPAGQFIGVTSGEINADQSAVIVSGDKQEYTAPYDAIYKNYFIYTDHPNYPTGYTGPTVVNEPPSESDKPTIRPDFTYQVNNKKVTAHDYNQDIPEFTPDEGYTFKGYEVEWKLRKCGTWIEDGNICSDAEQVAYDILLQDKDFTYEVEEYGDYELEALYLVQQCYRYPSYPATPDYCFYVEVEAEFPDYEFSPTKIHLVIDGSSFTGDTSEQTCLENGYCYDEAEDCTVKETFIEKLTCQTNNSFTTGVLNPSITAFKNLFTSFVVDTDPACTIAIPNVTIIPGHAFPLSTYSTQACNHAEDFRDAFPFVAVLTNAMLALATFTLLAHMINRLTDQNDHSIVQGVK